MTWALRLPDEPAWKFKKPKWPVQSKSRFKDKTGKIVELDKPSIEDSAILTKHKENDEETKLPSRFEEIQVDESREEWRVALNPKDGTSLLPYFVSNFGRLGKLYGEPNYKNDLGGIPGNGLPSGVGLIKRKDIRKNKDGYRRFFVGRSTVYLHRTVARTFHGEPPSLDHTEVDHINANRWDNSTSNLRWVTHKQNEAAKRTQGGDTRIMNKAEYDTAVQLLQAGYKANDIANQLGRNPSSIYRLKKRLKQKGKL